MISNSPTSVTVNAVIIPPAAPLEPSPKMLQKTPLPGVPQEGEGAVAAQGRMELERVNQEMREVAGDLERRVAQAGAGEGPPDSA